MQRSAAGIAESRIVGEHAVPCTRDLETFLPAFTAVVSSVERATGTTGGGRGGTRMVIGKKALVCLPSIAAPARSGCAVVGYDHVDVTSGMVGLYAAATFALDITAGHRHVREGCPPIIAAAASTYHTMQLRRTAAEKHSLAAVASLPGKQQRLVSSV